MNSNCNDENAILCLFLRWSKVVRLYAAAIRGMGGGMSKMFGLPVMTSSLFQSDCAQRRPARLILFLDGEPDARFQRRSVDQPHGNLQIALPENGRDRRHFIYPDIARQPGPNVDSRQRYNLLAVSLPHPDRKGVLAIDGSHTGIFDPAFKMKRFARTRDGIDLRLAVYEPVPQSPAKRRQLVHPRRREPRGLGHEIRRVDLQALFENEVDVEVLIVPERGHPAGFEVHGGRFPGRATPGLEYLARIAIVRVIPGKVGWNAGR